MENACGGGVEGEILNFRYSTKNYLDSKQRVWFV